MTISTDLPILPPCWWVEQMSSIICPRHGGSILECPYEATTVLRALKGIYLTGSPYWDDQLPPDIRIRLARGEQVRRDELPPNLR